MQKRFCDVCLEEIDPDLGFYSLIARAKGRITIPDEEPDICSVKCLIDYGVKLDRRVVRVEETNEGQTKIVKFIWHGEEVIPDTIEEIDGRYYLTKDAYSALTHLFREI